jgi:hypothetical protein
MRDPKETAEASACVRFAREFLPEVNKALAEVQSDVPGGEASATPTAQAASAESKPEAAKPAETASTEPAPAEKKAAESIAAPSAGAAAPSKESSSGETAKPAAKANP